MKRCNLFYIFYIVILFFIRGQICALDEADVKHALQHKIILCIGPALDRKVLLQTTITNDSQYIPFKKIFLITNDAKNLNLDIDPLYEIKKILMPIRDKQLDCLNAILLSLKMVANDTSCLPDDIIVFTHESVLINDMHLLTQAIGKIMAGYDAVCKYWIGFDNAKNSKNLNDYFHTDAFVMSVQAARTLSNALEPVNAFTNEFSFCEEYFTKFIMNKLNVFAIPYHHSSWKDNELGFYHIPRYEEDPNWYWDKKNYDSVYQ